MKNTRAVLTQKIKLLALALACVLVLGVCFGCGRVRYSGPVSSQKMISVGDSGSTSEMIIDYIEDVQKKIIGTLNRGKWSDGLSLCGSDFEFTVRGKDNLIIKIVYHSECGRFNDLTNKRSMKLSEKGRQEFNGLLGSRVLSSTGKVVDIAGVSKTGSNSDIRFLLYNWDGSGVSTKRIDACELTGQIIDGLEMAEETGEKVARISDEGVNECSEELPVKPGTLWLEEGSKIYRIDPDTWQICRVDGHLGEGVVLSVSSELKSAIQDLWYYYPYDYYSGKYVKKTDEIEFRHVYDGESNIHVSVNGIELDDAADNPKNKIILELTSAIDQTVSISLMSQSGCVVFCGDGKTVDLKAGEARSVELGFSGWPSGRSGGRYSIHISLNDLRIIFTIDP